ncbi:hypothetical protein [Aeromonas popoffii]|uniref:hypothetical protein n=1 Tax=Aeromonas popoffii TaxID=70856 RepID=UPI0030CAC9B9
MTVPNIPFWLSDANTEFGGNGWATDICAKAGLALPVNLINLAGRSSDTKIVMTIGVFNPGYENQIGYFSNAAGAISPNTHKGRLITTIGGFDDQPDLLYVGVDKPSPLTVTIEGAGTMIIPAGEGKIRWPGIISWLWARNGQKVNVTLKSDS